MFSPVSGLILPEKIPGWAFYSEGGVSILSECCAKSLRYPQFGFILSILAILFAKGLPPVHSPFPSFPFFAFPCFFYLFPLLVSTHFPTSLLPSSYFPFYSSYFACPIFACLTTYSRISSFIISIFFRNISFHLLLIQNKVVPLQPQFGV